MAFRLPDETDVGYRGPSQVGRMINQGDGNSFQIVDRAIAGVNQALQADNAFRLQSAKVQFMVGQDKLLASLDDEDYDTYEERYTQGMEAVREQSYGMIQSSRDKELLDNELQIADARGSIEIAARRKGKEKEMMRGTLDQNLLDVRESMLKSATPGKYVPEVDTLIRGAITSGYITPEDGVRMRQGFSVDVAEARLEMMPVDQRMEALRHPDEVTKLLPADKIAALEQKATVEAATLMNAQYTQERRMRESMFNSAWSALSEVPPDKVSDAVNGIPASALAAMTPAQIKSLREEADRISRGIGSITTHEMSTTVYDLLKDKSPAGRQKLADFDLEGAKSQMSPDTFASVDRERAIARGEREGKEKFIEDAYSDGAVPYLNGVIASLGIDSTQDRVTPGIFIQMVNDKVIRERGDATHVSEKRFREIVAETAVEQKLNQYGGLAGLNSLFTKNFTVGSLSSGVDSLMGEVGSAERWRPEIVKAITAEGQNPTEGAIANMWLDVNKAVPGIISKLQKEGKPYSEAEIMRVYQTLRANRNKKKDTE